MSNSESKPIKQQFLHALVNGSDANQSLFEEYRSVLEEKLLLAEQRQRRGRFLTKVMWTVTGCLALAGLLLHLPGLSLSAPPAGLLLIGLAVLMALLSLLRTILYFGWDGRAMHQLRDERRDCLLMELERQVRTIGQRLDELTASRGGQ